QNQNNEDNQQHTFSLGSFPPSLWLFSGCIARAKLTASPSPLYRRNAALLNTHCQSDGRAVKSVVP
ncbi:MAG: hypothetical protein WA192_08925, partial [Candidatus Acidiferrales bacterium]